MKIEITQWLQEAIYEHAQGMAVAQAIKEHGGDTNTWYANDNSGGGYGSNGYREEPNPSYGFFKFEVSRSFNDKATPKSTFVELEVRAVVKDYVS
jgi:hypothetical protein